MKLYRLLAVLLIIPLCLGIFSGCGTSTPSASEEDSIISVPDDESWEELVLPSASRVPITDTVMPELEDFNEHVNGVDVTDEYKNSFLGTWDNEDKTLTYEFKGNENLIITRRADKASQTYTYWFEEVGTQVRLCIFKNGQEEASVYSFTLSGRTMTLYDVNTGSAVEMLTRQEVETPTPAPSVVAAATPRPTTNPSATAAPAPSSSAVPSQVPSQAPSTAPSAEPSPSASAEISPSPAVSTSPEVSPSPSPAVELPATVAAAMPRVECVLDVVLEGVAFNAADPASFWNTMVRYLSRSNESDEDGYFTVSRTVVEASAAQVYSGIKEIPQLPEGFALAEMIPADEEAGTEEQYRIRWGAAGGHELEVVTFDETTGTLTVLVDGATDYQVVLDAGGAVVSVTVVG